VCDACSCTKLNTYDWLENLPNPQSLVPFVEVRFKNTRKGFYANVNNLNLKKGDMIAVEASPGHDIGTVSLTGELVLQQMRKNRVSPNMEFKKVYRIARPVDIEKWENSIEREESVMLRARQIAAEIGMKMKIGDVEFQGDGTKAIFYYIADERVDFRELIRFFADEFRIRVEMKQIGARQEAGRIGGIGSCGRELCCSTWMSSFVTVSTQSARVQELSLNPQKLAGQCGKLKCCLNYEKDTYIDARKGFPSTHIPLQTKTGTAYYQKTDVLKALMWYSINTDASTSITAIPIKRVKEIIALNEKGEKVDSLLIPIVLKDKPLDYANVVGEESLTRFDKKRKPTTRRRKSRSGTRNKQQANSKKTPSNTQSGSKKTPTNTQSSSKKTEQGNNPSKRRYRPRKRKPNTKNTDGTKTNKMRQNKNEKSNKKDNKE